METAITQTPTLTAQKHKTMSFIPATYDQSQIASGNSQAFFKVKDGENKIRILSHELCFGFEYWTVEDKPKRVKNRPSVTPSDIRYNDEGKPEPVKHIWAMQVWDYADNQVKVWSFSQSSLMTPLASYFNDEDWGHPNQYDLKITKSGSGLKTKYSVVPSPKKPLTQEQQDAVEDKVNTFDLNSLFSEEQTLPQRTMPPQQQVEKQEFSEIYGTSSEGALWAKKLGVSQEIANKILAEVNAIAEERKQSGEPMTNNERRKAFIEGVNSYLAANPDIVPEPSKNEGLDDIPF